MSSRDEKTNAQSAMGRQLRRIAASEANRRRLLELPLFKINSELPQHIDALMRELDAAENAPARR